MKLQILPEFIDSYNDKINSGKQYCTQLNIAIVGLARNIDVVLSNSLKILDDLSLNFKNYQFVIYENDSIDNTKQILLNWSNNNLKKHIISENLGANHPTNSVKDSLRTLALSSYRNKCKNYIKDNLSNIDYVIVCDLDFCGFDKNSIFNSFGWLKEGYFDAMVGNAYFINEHTKNRIIHNYDSWAFRLNWWEDYQSFMPWFMFWIPFIGTSPIKVNSAFGGIGIYKANQYFSVDYDGYDCEHVCFHKNLYNKYQTFRLGLNPSQIIYLC